MRQLRPALLLLLALASGACTLGLDFEEEGRACDAQGQCLEGYACVEGACERDATLDCAACDGGVGCPGADAGAGCP